MEFYFIFQYGDVVVVLFSDFFLNYIVDLQYFLFLVFGFIMILLLILIELRRKG